LYSFSNSSNVNINLFLEITNSFPTNSISWGQFWSNKNSKKSENKYKKNKNYKIYKYKKFLKKYGNQLNESKYSIVKSSIYLTAMEVIRENNLIYITIRIKNESSNEYQILNSKNNPELYLRKYNYGLLKLSKNTTSNIPVKDKIVAVLLPDKHRINSGNKGYIIYVIKQFGISSNNFIRAEIIEKNGNRDITIEAKWESLN